MQRRIFCQSSLAAAVAAALPGCDSRTGTAEVDVGTMIPAISGTGEEISLETAAVAELADTLKGHVFLQADEGYAAAKQIWNGMFDGKKPALVVQCSGTDDIVNAVNFARERTLLVSVKCGGHSFPGKSTSDGGMMIDLSHMHAVDVDAEAKTLRADGGALLAHIDGASLRSGLLTTTGIVSHTGAGGFTLGGGLGRTDRKMGLAIDNLLSAKVVTASGEVVRASEDENADLFWGLRGGGGNFGIATEFVYRLHPFNPTVYAGYLKYDVSEDLLHAYAEFNETLPDEANVEPSFGPGDDGKPVATIEVCWCGDHAAGEKALAPLLGFPGFRGGELGAMEYHAMQTGADSFFDHGRQYYLKSGFLGELTADSIEVIIESARRGGPVTWFQHMGGATSRVASGATAYSHRDAAFNFGVMYAGDDPAKSDAAIAAIRAHYKAMEPFMTGFYTNLNEDSERKTWGNYGENYPRLVGLKKKYDPTNFFRLNANVSPAA